jgi:hypothetical protein
MIGGAIAQAARDLDVHENVLRKWVKDFEAQFRKFNPAFGIKPLKIGRIRAWTDDELTAFEDKWPLGTLERTGFALASYMAQRSGDEVDSCRGQDDPRATQQDEDRTRHSHAPCPCRSFGRCSAEASRRDSYR